MKRLTSLPTLAIWLMSSAALLSFVVVAVIRLWYPYELEWLESGMVEHVRRMLDGQNIYTEPTVEFVTFPYGPMTTIVGSAISWPFGAHFWELRLVSILSTLGTIALLIRLVRTETGRWTPAVAAGGIYVGAYAFVGAWYDVAKPDSLFLFFTLAAVALLQKAPSSRHVYAAGVIIGLAILTKQTALLVALALLAHLLLRDRRNAAQFTVASVLTVLAVSAPYLAANSWYDFFVWDLLRQHESIESPWWKFFTEDLHTFLPAVILIAATAWHWAKRPNTTMYWAAALALIVGAWMARQHSGGYTNVLMPAVLAIAMLAGIGLGQAKTVTASIVVRLAVILQLCLLAYNPWDQLPTDAQRKGVSAAIATIENVDGDVLVLSHPTYGVLAGKNSHASLGGIADVIRGSDESAKQRLQSSIDAAVTSGRFAAIALDTEANQDVLPADWKNYYTKSESPLIADGRATRPVTGWVGPPTQLWHRNTAETRPTP